MAAVGPQQEGLRRHAEVALFAHAVRVEHGELFRRRKRRHTDKDQGLMIRDNSWAWVTNRVICEWWRTLTGKRSSEASKPPFAPPMCRRGAEGEDKAPRNKLKPFNAFAKAERSTIRAEHPDIAKKEARRLIEEEPPRAETKRGGGGGDVLGGDQKMFFDDGENPADAMLNLEDPFTRQMAETHAPIVCDREMLRALPPEDVVIKPSGCSPLPPRYFRVMDPDAPIAVDEAGNAYEADEYELACLERGRTPFTRKPVNPDSEMTTAAPVMEPDTPPAKSKGWGAARAMATVSGMELGTGEKRSYNPGRARARRSLVETSQ